MNKTFKNQHRQIISILALALMGCSLTSCDVSDAVSATKAMPDKIDQTNDQVSTTNRKMDRTNDSIDQTNTNMLAMKAELQVMRSVMEAMEAALLEMKDLMAQMKQETSALSSKMDATNSKMDSMNQKMETTIHSIDATNRKMEKVNSAIHKQTLVAAMTEMLKPENTRYLFPPTAMMPAGQTFAEEAVSNEIVQLVYVYLKDIDEVQPDESLRVQDGKFSDPLIKEMDHNKQMKFTALEVITGLMPHSVVEEAVQTEVHEGGRYDNTVLSLLMLRTLFIKSILIDEDLFSYKIDDLGKVEEAIKRVSDLDWIARLPFANQIAVKTRGMLNPDNNINEKLDPRMTVPMWDHLAMSLETEIDPAKIGNSPEAKAKLQRFKDLVKSYQEYWNPTKNP